MKETLRQRIGVDVGRRVSGEEAVGMGSSE